MKQRLAWFVVGGLLFWATATGLAYCLWDATKSGPFEEAMPYIAVAGALCLIPSVLTLLWVAWSTAQTPERQLTAALGGTGVRMFVVLAAGLLLTQEVPYFTEHRQSFWLWVLVFYLFDLGLEMAILLSGRAEAEKQSAQQ